MSKTIAPDRQDGVFPVAGETSQRPAQVRVGGPPAVDPRDFDGDDTANISPGPGKPSDWDDSPTAPGIPMGEATTRQVAPVKTPNEESEDSSIQLMIEPTRAQLRTTDASSVGERVQLEPPKPQPPPREDFLDQEEPAARTSKAPRIVAAIALLGLGDFALSQLAGTDTDTDPAPAPAGPPVPVVVTATPEPPAPAAAAAETTPAAAPEGEDAVAAKADIDAAAAAADQAKADAALSAQAKATADAKAKARARAAQRRSASSTTTRPPWSSPSPSSAACLRSSSGPPRPSSSPATAATWATRATACTWATSALVQSGTCSSRAACPAGESRSPAPATRPLWATTTRPLVGDRTDASSRLQPQESTS